MLRSARPYLSLLILLCSLGVSCDREDTESEADTQRSSSKRSGRSPRPSQRQSTGSQPPSGASPVTAGNGGGGGGHSASSFPAPMGTSGFPGSSSISSTAGSGTSLGSPATGTAGSAGPVATCATTYIVATHITIDVEWSGSLALAKGAGQVHLWSKSQFVETGDTATVVSKSCGSVLPEIKTTSLAGGYSVLPEIPDTAWDQPGMPMFTGTATRLATGWRVDPGVALVGLNMPDPSARWPDADEITGVDVDGDGNPGITAYPRVGGRFAAPPTNLSQSAHVEELYLAIRSVLALTSTSSGCPAAYGGEAAVTGLDNHVIGCRVEGGIPCTDSERDFVDSNRTEYKIQGGSFVSHRVDDDVTCADVRALLPVR